MNCSRIGPTDPHLHFCQHFSSSISKGGTTQPCKQTGSLIRESRRSAKSSDHNTHSQHETGRAARDPYAVTGLRRSPRTKASAGHPLQVRPAQCPRRPRRRAQYQWRGTCRRPIWSSRDLDLIGVRRSDATSPLSLPAGVHTIKACVLVCRMPQTPTRPVSPPGPNGF